MEEENAISSSYSSEEGSFEEESSLEREYISKRSNKLFRIALKEDRISSLPDSLLQRILSFLDTKQAVLTGILSSRWRTLWTTIPNLNFTIRCRNYHPPGYDNEAGDDVAGVDTDFINFVDRTLILHFNSNLQRFRLSFYYNLRYASRVDAWIRFAVARDVHELDLEFGLIRNSSGQYRLPSWLFKCESLVSLKLKCCEIGVTSCVRFSSLTALSLTHIGLSGGVIEKMLNGCPLLEDLVFSHCKSSSRVRVASSMSTMILKRLTIEICSFESGLEIQAPNLQVLNFDDLICEHTKYFLSDMLFLREVDLRLRFGIGFEMGYESEDFNFNFACVLESLLKYLGHAKVLKLCTKCIQEFMKKYDDDDGDYWKSLAFSIPCMEHHLKTIKITGFIGVEHQWPVCGRDMFRCFVDVQDTKIELVQFMLKNAMVLEKMIIHTFRRPNFASTEEWTKMILMVAEKLMAIPKASSNAHVLFSYN